MADEQPGLMEFLNARLEEERAAAERACPPRRPVQGGEVWSVGEEEAAEEGAMPTGVWVVTGPDGNDGIAVVNGNPRADHIAHWDPRRVLREVEVKEWLLRRHNKRRSTDWDRPGHVGWECAQCTNEYPCPTVAILVLPYEGHPDFKQEWRKGLWW